MVREPFDIPERDLLQRVCETNFAYLALGNERFEAHGAWFTRNRSTPRRHDANCVGLIRAGGTSEIEALLARAEAEFRDFSHRRFAIDPLTPPQFTARLALEDGYSTGEELVLLLEGELRASPKPVEIRELADEGGLEAYRRLDAMWWQENSTEVFGPYDGALHDEFLLNDKLKAPAVRRWLAYLDGEARAFLSSYPGENGVGMVENLYCEPAYRHRGLATALLAHCVADARARGAGPVLINADAKDTPRQMYAALGFRPLFVARIASRGGGKPPAPSP